MTAPLPPVEIRRISDAVPYWAKRRGDEEAVVFGRRRMRWSDLRREVDRCARALLARGVRRGDRVALLGTPRPEYLITFLATARIGAIWVGLNPKYTLEELAYVVGDSEPRVLLGQVEVGGRDHRSDLDELSRRVDSIETTIALTRQEDDRLLDFDDFLACGEGVGEREIARVVDAVAPEDVCLIVYTSGSTGRPKGAMLTHHGLVHCSKVQGERWPTSTPPRVVDNFPINHVACTGDIASWVLIAGGLLVFQESFDPAATLAAVERERCNVWGGVPTMIQLCMALPDFDDYDLSSLELIVWGGAAAPRSLLQRLQRLGTRLATSYGMTETTGSVTWTDPEADLDTLADTVGRPEPRYEVRIAGADGRPCAFAEEGEVQVRGDFLMKGYFRRPDATADAFEADGWMHTGDVAVEREDGNYRLVGRLSEMYKSGGYNVYPREVELLLEEHPAIAMAAVVSVPDPLFQEVGHAFLLAAPGSEVREEEVRTWCRERLANYKVPKRFFVRAELPMLPVGKIDKLTLRRIAGDEAGELRS